MLKNLSKNEILRKMTNSNLHKIIIPYINTSYIKPDNFKTNCKLNLMIPDLASIIF